MDDLNKRIEEEEFLHDFINFLSYIVDNKVKLTPKEKWIPIKHIYGINALLKNPLQLENKIGDKVYKPYREYNVSRIFFIDLLAIASECVTSDDKDILVPGSMYNDFLGFTGITKKDCLMFAWCINMDWDIWMPEGDFGNTLQEKRLDLSKYIKDISKVEHMINFKKFAKTLIEGLNLKWIAPSQNSSYDFMEWGIKRCILLPLEWFDIITLCYSEEDQYGIRKTKGFYIKPTGKIFLEDLADRIERLNITPDNN